jgi:hypothetical protein
MSLFSGGRFGSAARAIPALLRGPLARQTLQFDEDRPGPLMPAARSARGVRLSAARYVDFTGMKSDIYDE